jgi:hypothetical protein
MAEGDLEYAKPENATTVTASNAKTNDDRNMVIWIVIFLVSIGGFYGTCLARRKEVK